MSIEWYSNWECDDQIIQDEFDFGEVQVTQQYADIYEVEE